MRFSLKWALAAMAYVALAVTALSTSHWGWAEALRVISGGAFVFAVLQSVVSRNGIQARAIGFAVAAALYMYCATTQDVESPADVLLSATWQEHTDGMPVQIGIVEALRRETQLRAANAIGATLAGLVGCGLGALAYRRGQAGD